MVIQYPHYLFALIGGESIQNEDGEWVEADATMQFLSMCREETDGRGGEVQTAGGTFRRYTSLIQLPKGTAKINDGTTVLVTNDRAGENVRFKGTAQKFDYGQLHCRLWA